MLTNLDEALERFQECDFEYGVGYTNQGPMAAEALEALGHPALIPAFVDVYLPRLRELPAGLRIAEHERDRAQGERSRRADWVPTWEAAIAEDGWEPVLEGALLGLLPGGFAAAGNGLLRTVHAIRGLHESDARLRRRELAFGLAHWSSRFQVLPGDPGARSKDGRNLDAVLRDLPVVAADRRRLGLMSEAVLVLEGDAGFAAELASVDLQAEPPERALSRLTRNVANLYLAHPESRIVYGHALRIPVAMGELLAVVPSEQHRVLVGLALQCVAALHGVYGTGLGEDAPGPLHDPEAEELAKSEDEIRYRAACSGEEHAITTVEACLRAHAADPADVLLRAAANAALRFKSSHAGRGG